MEKVLIVVPSYLPGYKSGGPQQTVQNICDTFRDLADIYVVTQNVDHGEKEPYNLETEKWLKLYGINVMYVPPEKYKVRLFRNLYSEFDTIMACGLFCSSTIDCMIIHNDNTKRLFVAPMGVFSNNALKIRSIKKKVFFKTFSVLGFFKRVIWSFTSADEYEEARRVIGERNILKHIIAEDLPRSIDFEKSRTNFSKKSNSLKIVFLSRIVPIKNLLYAINILKQNYDGCIEFDIYGPKEDEDYWRRCEKALRELPDNIQYRYCGSIKPDESISVFAQHDIFLFPTLGENFGHVIYESLAAGCLPLISDTTPWKDFDEKQCGNIVELENIEGFRKRIQEYIDMPSDVLDEMKTNAVDYAEQKHSSSVESSGYKSIFTKTISF